MTETPTHDPELELARQYGALRGLEDGRRAALGLIQANAYLDAYHREIQAAGLCNCPDDEEPLADWERNLLADIAKADHPAAPDLLYEAWCVIANAGWDATSGDTDINKTPGWHDAAIRWRDRYHAYLDTIETLPVDPTPSDTAGRAAEANQDSDGEAGPLVDLAGLKEAIDRQPYEPRITVMSPEEYERAKTDPRWTGKPEDAAADDAALQDTEADRDAEFKAAIDEADRRHRAAGFGRGLYLPVTGEADDLDQAGTEPAAENRCAHCGDAIWLIDGAWKHRPGLRSPHDPEPANLTSH